jgi:adenosylcobinamide-GDP ribazoletransferase
MKRDAPRLVASRRFLFLSRVFHSAAHSLGGIPEQTAFARRFFACSPHVAGGGRPRGGVSRDRDGGGLPFLAAPLAICSLVFLGGAMHEDGLADCADGFFGGATRERKLEIMQDSRIGTFGVVALVLSLYLRAASLALIVDKSLALAGAVLIGAAALSRAASLMPLVLIPPARENGAGFAAGKPERAALAVAACLAVGFALAPVVAGAYLASSLAGITAATGAAYAIALLARKQIGGQTGDVAGTAQQLSEIAYYLAFATGA